MRVLIFVCLCFAACSTSTETKRSDHSYFDLKGFFEKEATRMNKTHPPVIKTVSRNGVSESRTAQPDWRKELTLFAESDINKPAWKDAYRIISLPNGDVEYHALEDNLKTRRIIIRRSANIIRSIQIQNRTTNFLYESTEDLRYYPDSLYMITKKQRVKVLGQNQYLITGEVK